MKFGFTPEAEILNSRLAMLGFVIAVGTYMTTGQIIPGVLQMDTSNFLALVVGFMVANFLLIIIKQSDDDNGGGDGGMMVPITNPT